MNKVVTVGFWISLGLTSLAFILAGLAKLAGVEQMHMSFAVMGLPAWFGYFIGACELSGGIALNVRKLSSYAACGLLIIMGGAIFFHTLYDSVANGIPAVVLSLLLINILVRRQKEKAVF